MTAAPTADDARAFRLPFAVVATGVFLAVLDLFIVNVAFPSIGADFDGTSVSGLSWILNAYTIVFAALLIPAGKLGDLVGRRRVFTGGLLLFALGSLLCAIAPSVEALVAARVLQAVGAAAVTPTSLGLLLPIVAPERRARVIGAWASIGAVGAAAGPPIGGLLVEASWHLIFLVNVPIAIVAAILTPRVLAEVRDPEQARVPDLLGVGLLIVAVAALTLGLVEGPEWGWDLRVVASFAVAAAATAWLVVRSRVHHAPAIEPEVVGAPGFALATLGAAFFYLALGAMLLANVLFLSDVWQYSPLRAGLALAPGAVVAALVAPHGGRAVPRFGAGVVGAAGGVLFALAGVWWIWRVGAEPGFLLDFLPGLLIGGAGVGLALPASTVGAVSGLPPARLATGIGALMTFRQVGATIGVAALVAILGAATPADGLAPFDDARILIIAGALASAVSLLALQLRSSVAPAPAASTA